MHKIHITKTYSQGLDFIFKKISDHATFLSGGGLRCEMIQSGEEEPNGTGAIRRVIAPKLTFEEKIVDFEVNQHFAYQIIKTIPKQSLEHEKGWLNFTEVNGQTRVDWYSNFTITTPIVGGLIGWVVKKQMSKAFLKRLDYLETK